MARNHHILHMSMEWMIAAQWNLRMRNVSDKICGENRKTHSMLGDVYLKVMLFMRWCWKTWCRVRQVTGDHTVQHVRFTSWLTEVMDTNTEYVVLTAFPLQQWLRECTSAFYLCMHCPSFTTWYCAMSFVS
jgi:hypothetical protein